MDYARTIDDLPNFTPIVKQCSCVKRICSPYSLAHATEHSSGDEPPNTVVYCLHEVDRASDTVQHNKEGTNPHCGYVPIRCVVTMLRRVIRNRVGHDALWVVREERRENSGRWLSSLVHDSALYNLTQYPTLTSLPEYLAYTECCDGRHCPITHEFGWRPLRLYHEPGRRIRILSFRLRFSLPSDPK
jgi:hypothetical protein